MIRPPPRSTLFPYPTLFQSQPLTAPAALLHRVKEDEALAPPPRLAGVGFGHRLGRVERDRVVVVDRKSTRLNSSHANISYAVFCLQKKHNEKRTPDI